MQVPRNTVQRLDIACLKPLEYLFCFCEKANIFYFAGRQRMRELRKPSNLGLGALLFVGVIALYAKPIHYPEPVLTDANMSVLIKEIKGAVLSDSLDLAVISPAGLIVGAVKVRSLPCGLPVWGDDGTTDSLDGCREGDSLRFVVWATRVGREFNLQPDDSLGVIIYHTNGLVLTGLQIIESPDTTTTRPGE